MAGEEEGALGTEGLSAGRGAALARLRPHLDPPSPVTSLEGLSISLPSSDPAHPSWLPLG